MPKIQIYKDGTELIGTLADGASFPPGRYGFRAVYENTVEKVRFAVDGLPANTEGSAPYFLDGDYNARFFNAGAHSIGAQAFVNGSWSPWRTVEFRIEGEPVQLHRPVGEVFAGTVAGVQFVRLTDMPALIQRDPKLGEQFIENRPDHGLTAVYGTGAGSTLAGDYIFIEPSQQGAVFARRDGSPVRTNATVPGFAQERKGPWPTRPGQRTFTYFNPRGTTGNQTTVYRVDLADNSIELVYDLATDPGIPKGAWIESRVHTTPSFDGRLRAIQIGSALPDLKLHFVLIDMQTGKRVNTLNVLSPYIASREPDVMGPDADGRYWLRLWNNFIPVTLGADGWKIHYADMKTWNRELGHWSLVMDEDRNWHFAAKANDTDAILLYDPRTGTEKRLVDVGPKSPIGGWGIHLAGTWHASTAGWVVVTRHDLEIGDSVAFAVRIRDGFVLQLGQLPHRHTTYFSEGRLAAASHDPREFALGANGPGARSHMEGHVMILADQWWARGLPGQPLPELPQPDPVPVPDPEPEPKPDESREARIGRLFMELLELAAAP